MYAVIEIENLRLKVDLGKPMDISIPLCNSGSPVAFGAAPFKATPYKSGDFTGSLEAGSPVNFYNLHINPHGNGTHTESVLHIDARGATINKTLLRSHFVCLLITVKPYLNKEGDFVIDENCFPSDLETGPEVKALIVRTIPNTEEKKKRNHTGTNPCYMLPEVIARINEMNIDHLLVDFPSIDKEQDGGALRSHKEYWKVDEKINRHKTITEMVYVDNKIEDGKYFLNLQIISVEGDASPSKPVLYKIIQ